MWVTSDCQIYETMKSLPTGYLSFFSQQYETEMKHIHLFYDVFALPSLINHSTSIQSGILTVKSFTDFISYKDGAKHINWYPQRPGALKHGNIDLQKQEEYSQTVLLPSC